MAQTVTVTRPEHLPDFKEPPLREVVLGVQFSPPKGYQQIHAGGVWDLFRTDYPQVQEQVALPPSFEAFGIPHQRSFASQFQIGTGTMHDRFWFLRPDGDELIQFQQDRLLHNWRKVGDEIQYPRFESMIARLSDELKRLEGYLNSLSPQSLQINQCEISYVNQINIGPSLKRTPPSDWLRFLDFGAFTPEDFSLTFREVLRDASGNPTSRLTCELASASLPNGDDAMLFTLTVRGAPTSPSIGAALEFLANGRQVIVQRFAELTTEAAHRKWERTK